MGSLGNNHSPSYYAERIGHGDIAVLSRVITFAESSHPAQQQLAREIIRLCGPPAGPTFRLGITGVPGVGKSTFIESFGLHLYRQGHRLAVLAVDPTSSRSRGSILGDKTRMQQLSALDRVYIRPSPSGGALGGITRVTYESIALCEAAGFNYVMVETVGVGQSEVAVSQVTDFFLLLMLAGAGDELQGIKRGIMEMADALVITKADGGNEKKAATARAEYSRAVKLLQTPESGWLPPVLSCSAETGKGIEEIAEMIGRYRSQVTESGYLDRRRRDQQVQIFRDALSEAVLKRFGDRFNIEKRISEVLSGSGYFDPYSEVARALADAGL